MSAAFKYIATGLMIGMCAAALVGLAVLFSLGDVALPSPFARPTATSTPTATLTITPTAPPTETPLPTPTPLPTDTPSPVPPTPTLTALEQMMQDGSLSFAGPLSNVEQIHLYQASLKYIGASAADSRRISKEINGVGYGDPTNICGPLSIAILRDAELMTPEILPHDFWLLNPVIPEDRRLLNTAFPSDRYDYSKVITPLNKIDWHASPLVPGDFLFIWHGSWGNFDHMLVVTRIDREQRVYAVTNHGTADGYVITEALLYDPNDASAGLFHLWTQERDAILGSTGFGGYELWRRKLP